MLEFFRGIFESFLGLGTWREVLQDTWMIALLIAAFIWGRGPEKVAISIWIAVHVIGNYLETYVGTPFVDSGGILIVALVGDSVLCVGFLVLALLANRQYTLWIAAFQVIAMLAHVLRAINEDMTFFVYLFMVFGVGWAQIVLMTGGQISQLRRKKGVYADWLWQVERPSPRPVSRNVPETEPVLATR